MTLIVPDLKKATGKKTFYGCFIYLCDCGNYIKRCLTLPLGLNVVSIFLLLKGQWVLRLKTFNPILLGMFPFFFSSSSLYVSFCRHTPADADSGPQRRRAPPTTVWLRLPGAGRVHSASRRRAGIRLRHVKVPPALLSTR